MKTIGILLCILGLGTTVVTTNTQRHTNELMESTTKWINLNKQSNIEVTANHAKHNDIVRINGKTLCEKTQTFYKTH